MLLKIKSLFLLKLKMAISKRELLKTQLALNFYGLGDSYFKS